MSVRFPMPVAILALVVATPLVAQAFGVGGPMGGYPNYGSSWSPRSGAREGKAQAVAYVTHSPAASALGRGDIAVALGGGNLGDQREGVVYQTAVAGQLSARGYRTGAANNAAGQVATLVISHNLVEPAEQRHRPLSGEVAVGGGSRWSGTSVGIGIDLTKPRGELLSTRLDARIVDRVTNERLWEGHATINSREGDRRWSDERLAEALATALFSHFPRDS